MKKIKIGYFSIDNDTFNTLMECEDSDDIIFTFTMDEWDDIVDEIETNHNYVIKNATPVGGG